jgi:hypothetical protein
MTDILTSLDFLESPDHDRDTNLQPSAIPAGSRPPRGNKKPPAEVLQRSSTSRRLREKRRYQPTQLTITVGSNWRLRNSGGRQDLISATVSNPKLQHFPANGSPHIRPPPIEGVNNLRHAGKCQRCPASTADPSERSNRRNTHRAAADIPRRFCAGVAPFAEP